MNPASNLGYLRFLGSGNVSRCQVACNRDPLFASNIGALFPKVDDVKVPQGHVLASMGSFRIMYVVSPLDRAHSGVHRAALAFKIVTASFSQIEERKSSIYTGLSVAVALVFWIYAPFSYHRLLTYDECEMRNVPMHTFNCVGK